jgi:hypothetical protein
VGNGALVTRDWDRLAVPTSFDRGAGRLGNQMWQLASTVGVALSGGLIPAVPDDWTYRDVFAVPDEWYVPRPILGRLPSVLDTTPARSMLAPRWREYLQAFAMWSEHADVVRDVFDLKPAAAAAVDPIVTRVAAGHGPIPRYALLPRACVHVRRGDNVTNDRGTINCLPVTYYEDAFGAVNGAPDGLWREYLMVMFSDDPQYCADVFERDMPTFVQWDGVIRMKEVMATFNTEPDVLDWVDLAVMARCEWDAFVMSNSTYAWWSAFLSGCERVIRPSYWFGPQLFLEGIDPELMFDGLPWQRIETGSVWDERP